MAVAGCFFVDLDGGRLVFACTGTGAFSGLAGRGSTVFAGDPALNGGCMNVRELLDFGDKTVPGAALRVFVRVALEAPVALLVVTAGAATAVAVGFILFLGFSRACVGFEFSLSDNDSLGRFTTLAKTGLESCCTPAGFCGDSAFCAGLACSMYLSTSSCMLTFLNAGEILFTRISSRDRSPWACSAYCARSLRARSVTSSCRLSINACFCASVIASVAAEALISCPRSGVVTPTGMVSTGVCVV